jgi:hypothetical protein
MEMMEAQMLNSVYLKMLPRFNTETIKVGDFVIIKRKTGKADYSSAAVQVTAVREDELLVRVVEVLGRDRYFEINQSAYVAGESVTINPKDVNDGTVEIWPAKAVIPGV